MIKQNIKATNLELTPALRDYVAGKLEHLKRFLDDHDESLLADVEIGKETHHHRHGQFYRAEINLRAAAGKWRAVARHDDLYAAIDEAKDEMVRIIRSRRGRRLTLVRRGGRAVKGFLRGLRRRP